MGRNRGCLIVNIRKERVMSIIDKKVQEARVVSLREAVQKPFQPANDTPDHIKAERCVPSCVPVERCGAPRCAGPCITIVEPETKTSTAPAIVRKFAL